MSSSDETDEEVKNKERRDRVRKAIERGESDDPGMGEIVEVVREVRSEMQDES